ncbi:hypothetical protein MPSI1_000302 [Malassezia psittaci]|uniref:Uncharacterized protein n=1 Tax=Malassezia psittaci TaxID=1821823 RepID=A0AAF0JCS2_9BASI|nr:hypothetical protein MPSI1_000302 [Malassezia psittaci]
MAALGQLCKGDRAIRDRTRLFIDRVKLWESQGNARSMKEIHAGVPAVCAWLADEILERKVIERDEMMRASGLSPEKFAHAEKLVRQVVSDPPRTRTRRQSGASVTDRKEPRAVSKPPVSPEKSREKIDKNTLLDRAKAAQSGALFRPASQREITPAQIPESELRTAPVLRKKEKEKRAGQPEPKRMKKSEPTRETNSPHPVPDGLPPIIKHESEEAQAYQRLVSLGIPAHREGLKFEIEPRRKRGRPPGQKKTIPQWMQDADRIAPSDHTLEASASILPARYMAANLSHSELQCLRPLPVPMVMSTANPSGVRAKPSEVWARWASLWDLD